MRVVAFTSGLHVPSSRFRVRQFIPALAALGVDVVEHASEPDKYAPCPFGVPKFVWDQIRLTSRRRALRDVNPGDVTWLEREFLAGRRTLEGRAGDASRRVFDVDDAIWLQGEPDFSEQIARECAGVIAGNAWLAEHYRPHAKRVWVVPTAVDPARWAPATPYTPDRRFVIGWTGTSANFRYLLDLEDPLREFLDRHADAEVLVVADKAPAWRDLPRARFERWTPDGEPALVRSMAVGLMPLADEEWAKGKCAAKMLVYMAAEVPCVVSPVGINADILAVDDVGLAARTPEDWVKALEELHGDREGSLARGRRGRAVVDKEYSVAVNARRLADIFGSLA